jgi:hypothetical protein
MKKIILLSSLCFLLLTLVVKAQTPPNAFNYSAVARNAVGQPIASTTIGIQITILKTSPTGASQYSENHFVNTDAFGLFNLVIGAGAVQSGSMAAIDWSIDNYYIRVGMDASGGTNFLTMGTTQLLSVPYALHAKTADTITGTIIETDPIFGASVASGITGSDTTNWNSKQDQLVAGTNITIVGDTISAIGGGSSNDFYLGQDTLGGIVFYIYIGGDGNQHGLIVNKNESTAQWQSSGTTTNATRSWDGVYNTGLMTGSPAAMYVNGLTDGGFTDWYLPSLDELNILWNNRFHANKALNTGGFTLLSNNGYWSSTEANATGAFGLYFYDGNPSVSNKNSTTGYVRAVRAF